ncbi:MAG TPA: SRPBCC family protein [Mucilaginibacter sp.]|jgi:uncharacterized protein YndB with AHSA1/START domain|nr:SRPBCC family protein [Mucilaginibacter sp.]
METTENTVITIEAIVNVPVEKAWEVYTNPKHVTQWNHASDDWHSPSAENDLRVGGAFSYRMEAKDGSFGFDFGGIYDEVKPNELLSYTIGDGRTVKNVFAKEGNATKVTVTFEAENQNPVEMQRGGWQAILDNFKMYAESVK